MNYNKEKLKILKMLNNKQVNCFQYSMKIEMPKIKIRVLYVFPLPPCKLFVSNGGERLKLSVSYFYCHKVSKYSAIKSINVASLEEISCSRFPREVHELNAAC